MARIKVIDDDVDFASDVSGLLTGVGHEVTVLDTTDGAVKALLEERPDLLVLDVMFPDNAAGGFDLARSIRMHREIRKLPIILLTGMNQEFPMDFSAEDIDPDWMPVQDFVEKPIDPGRLIAAIDKLLNT